jgi:hypothetical protein
MSDRILVHRVGGHARIVADSHVSDCPLTAAWRTSAIRF